MDRYRPDLARPALCFFNSGVFPIGDGNGVTLTFDNDSDFGPAGLIAPNHFTWSVQFFGFTGGDAVGVDLFDPVTVGSNTPDYWEYDGSTWTRRVSPDGPINFAARVEAVPEPSTIALGALGCVLGWGWSRRKRN